MKVCSGCEENITGLAYVCKDNQCDFNLHKSCFDLPEQIRHISHSSHPLTLIISPDQNNGFTCDGCHKNGFSFTYNCRICNFDLHPDCASLPKTVKRKDHNHPLTLYYDMNVEFSCDACQEISEGCWLYLCRKCDFGTHTYCVKSNAKPVISNPQLDYYNESEELMAALAAAKIRHKSNVNCLSYI
ncbi:DC1 domain-containing protein [Heracleum sosnowskyi]|uniref:DC1 domain-containing protein n=1 Tax=Heracleum sosnowskyi TaxID=360622 RepID=A0AAD8NB83_9APIA|nr:DC1 domain-containing protein [Heracleum sosnowskyi]